ncbi:MAG: hypothetical protein N2258_08830 [Brevinematales bacterium]|nr:hypothetical protein [Brevinematales bacterium]
MKVYKYLLALTIVAIFASCSTTPSSGGGGTTSSAPTSYVDPVIATLTNERIVLCSDDPSLGTPMDVDFNNPNPTTTHAVRFDPWTGGNATAYLAATTETNDVEHATVIQVDVVGSTTWGGGAGFQLTNNGLTQGTNLTRFATGGYIVLDVKLPVGSPNFKITIENGVHPNVVTSAEIVIGAGTYGESKNGMWHSIAIPISHFLNGTYTSSKLANVASPFQIRTIDMTGSATFYVDRIYWAR